MRWWRVFAKAISGSGRSEGRRRQSQRFAHRAPVSAKCSSWPKFAQLFTTDISAGGLFVPTDQPAQVGETIDLNLELPDGATLALKGTIVNVIGAEQAAARGRPPGIGIQLEVPTGDGAEQFNRVLEVARSQQLRPDVPPAPPPSKPFRAPTNAEPVRLSAVHDAIGDQFIDQIRPAELDTAGVDPLDDPLDDIAWDATLEPNPVQAPPPTITPVQAVVSGTIIGIDLGTSNTSVASIVGDRVKLLADAEGNHSFPSVVHVGQGGQITVGHAAAARLASDPAHTIVSPKRLLGRQIDDREIQAFLHQAAYRTKAHSDQSILIEIDGNDYAIVQLCGYLLAHARDIAEARLGERVDRAVMSVPVSFEDDRAALLRRAGKLAGLEIVAVIDEPSAAALSNRYDPGFGGLVGVYDFGGGTFDFSVVDVSGGDFIVLATAGDSWLGGDDFDIVLAEAAANQFWRKHKVDIRQQAVEWRALLSACERAKRQLSTTDMAAIHVKDVMRTAAGSVDLSMTIDRAIFNRACARVIERSLETCRDALELSGCQPSELTAVYLSGGTTHIPAIRYQLAQAFGCPVKTGVPPEFAVCLGTAIHAAQVQLHAATTLESR